MTLASQSIDLNYANTPAKSQSEYALNTMRIIIMEAMECLQACHASSMYFILLNKYFCYFNSLKTNYKKKWLKKVSLKSDVSTIRASFADI